MPGTDEAQERMPMREAVWPASCRCLNHRRGWFHGL